MPASTAPVFAVSPFLWHSQPGVLQPLAIMWPVRAAARGEPATRSKLEPGEQPLLLEWLSLPLPCKLSLSLRLRASPRACKLSLLPAACTRLLWQPPRGSGSLAAG